VTLTSAGSVAPCYKEIHVSPKTMGILCGTVFQTVDNEVQREDYQNCSVVYDSCAQ